MNLWAALKFVMEQCVSIFWWTQFLKLRYRRILLSLNTTMTSINLKKQQSLINMYYQKLFISLTGSKNQFRNYLRISNFHDFLKIPMIQGTIHFRRRQVFMIFDPYSVGKFGQFLTPPPKKTDVLNGRCLNFKNV